MYYIYNLVSYLCQLNYIIRIFIKLVIVSVGNRNNISTLIVESVHILFMDCCSPCWTGLQYPSQSWQPLPYSVQVNKISTPSEERFEKFLLKRISSKTLDNFCSAGWPEFQQTVKNVQLRLAWNLPLSEYDRKRPYPWGG